MGVITCLPWWLQQLLQDCHWHALNPLNESEMAHTPELSMKQLKFNLHEQSNIHILFVKSGGRALASFASTHV